MADLESLKSVQGVFREQSGQLGKHLASLDGVMDEIEETIPEFRSLPPQFRQRMLAQMEESTVGLEAIMATFREIVNEAELMMSNAHDRTSRARDLMRRMEGTE